MLFYKCRAFYLRYPQIFSTASKKFETKPEVLISRLSFSHIMEIVPIEDPLRDFFTNHLQEFLLEMGKGFCFEARQKRIIIDGECYFPDLILYNRILHCCVIVELKNNRIHSYRKTAN